MPLVLSLKTGDDFYVGNHRFVVGTVTSETNFTVINDGTKKSYDITDTRSTEILPDVFVSAGDKPTVMLARVAIDAPKNILVLRGDKVRNPPANRRT